MTTQNERSEALSLDEIRPADLVRLQQAAYQRDLERLQRHLDEFVAVACPACGAEAPQAAFEKYKFQFNRCGRCKTLYMSPRPTEQLMDGYYGNSENYKFWAEHIFPASENNRREKIHRPMLQYLLDICERHAIRQGTLVEVGPGFGTFAALASESGRFERVIGIERTPEMAKSCRDRGVTIIERAVEDVDPKEIGFADVLACFEVIEHLFAPERFLRIIGKLLRPGGLLLLTCPNGEGFDTMMLGARSVAVDSEHVNLFNPESLSALLRTMDFEIIEACTPGRLDAELVREAILDGSFDVSADPFLNRVLGSDWDRLGGPFQAFLAANNLSGHLRIVARRK